MYCCTSRLILLSIILLSVRYIIAAVPMNIPVRIVIVLIRIELK